MYYDDRSRTFNFVAGLALGAVIGASVALLAGPQGSRSTRKLLKAAAAGKRAARGKSSDLTREMRSAVRAGRRRLKL
jgi:gas vesicle protein